MRSRMEMIFVTSDGKNGYKTGVGAIFETDGQTWANFKAAKRLEVPKSKARFLLDYYNRRGDLSDTILLDAAGYSQIANEPVLTAAAYRKIDRDYWDKARAEPQKQAA